MCTCLIELNRKLVDSGRNTRIVLPILVDFTTGKQTRGGGAVVATEKIDTSKRGKAALLFASYCPFCGEKYEPAKEAN